MAHNVIHKIKIDFLNNNFNNHKNQKSFIFFFDEARR